MRLRRWYPERHGGGQHHHGHLLRLGLLRPDGGAGLPEKGYGILHHEEMESEVMRVAARSGFIDMTGSLLPGIDGFSTRMNVGIVSLMRQCTAYAVRFSHNSDHWFSPVLAKHFFDEN